MNARNIIVWSTKTQQKQVVSTGAETLAELKADLAAAGIDTKDMTFYEGLTKTELKADASLLPKDVSYKGTVTNELVIMLTVVNNKISSGRALTRTEVYREMKRNPFLADRCKTVFGRSYTQVSTAELVALINREKAAAVRKVSVKSSVKVVVPTTRPNVLVGLATLAEALFTEGVLSPATYGEITVALGSTPKEIKVGSYTLDEMNQMFDFAKK